jgi:TPR repeat protein
MNTSIKTSLSQIRMMILCEYPLSIEEYGHCYYDGDGVNKSTEEAYVWYQVAHCADNLRVNSLIAYLSSRLLLSEIQKLSSREKHLYFFWGLFAAGPLPQKRFKYRHQLLTFNSFFKQTFEHVGHSQSFFTSI